MLREALLMLFAAFPRPGANDDVDLLPGVRPPGDTPDLVPDAATSVYTLTDSDQTNIPEAGSGAYSLQFLSDIDEAYDCTVYATFSANVVAPTGANIYTEGFVNSAGVGFPDEYIVPVTTGQRVVMQLQFDVSAGDDWNVLFQATSAFGGGATADLSDIKWEINVIRR